MWRSLVKSNIDFIVILCTTILIVFGEVFIYSSSIAADGSIENYQYMKQLVWISIGIILMIFFMRINLDVLLAYSPQLYFGIMGILLLTGILAQDRNGTRAWLGFFGLGIQPSEFAKFCYIIFLSRYLGLKSREEVGGIICFLSSLGFTLLPMALIIFQGDVGTALVFAPIWFISLYVIGGNFQLLNHLFLFSLLFVALLFLQIWAPYSEIGGLVWNLSHIFSQTSTFIFYIVSLSILLILAIAGFLLLKIPAYKIAISIIALILVSSVLTWEITGLMKPYMKGRIISFLNPEIDRLSSSWNLTQSVRAIGSGGIWGKGFLNGLIAHYGYLPEQSQSTDFLFAIIGEEGGFFMGFLVFLATFILIGRMILIARNSDEPVESAIAIAISAVFLFHFLQNVGMTIHLMPITGIPLLLVSYGGSSLVTSMAMIGVVLNIYAHRKH